MANISFDKHRNANIIIENVGNDISFLMSSIFDNSESNLLRDIQLCDNEEMKRILMSFYEYIKSLEKFCYEVEGDADVSESEISLELEAGDDGDWCAVVHNIKAEHSGYWYAAQNLDAEKYSLIQLHHKLEGIKIAVENIDSAITSIKSAVSNDDAASKLIELGLDMQQAKAILRMNITSIICCDSSTISDRIALCNKWIEFISNYK